MTALCFAATRCLPTIGSAGGTRTVMIDDGGDNLGESGCWCHRPMDRNILETIAAATRRSAIADLLATRVELSVFCLVVGV